MHGSDERLALEYKEGKFLIVLYPKVHVKIKLKIGVATL